MIFNDTRPAHPLSLRRRDREPCHCYRRQLLASFTAPLETLRPRPNPIHILPSPLSFPLMESKSHAAQPTHGQASNTSYQSNSSRDRCGGGSNSDRTCQNDRSSKNVPLLNKPSRVRYLAGERVLALILTLEASTSESATRRILLTLRFHSSARLIGPGNKTFTISCSKKR